MSLLERVSTLMRANLNDLLEKAEDPNKISKQILLDMANQLMQLKTQVAIAIADGHRLGKQRAEQEALGATWRRKAELAVSKGDDDLARAALERALSHGRLAEGFAEQERDQANEAETLRGAYTKLQGKLHETKARVDLLMAQHRRNRVSGKAEGMLAHDKAAAKLERLEARVDDGAKAALTGRAMVAIGAGETLEERFRTMEQADQIEALLAELKGGGQARLE